MCGSICSSNSRVGDRPAPVKHRLQRKRLEMDDSTGPDTLNLVLTCALESSDAVNINVAIPFFVAFDQRRTWMTALLTCMKSGQVMNETRCRNLLESWITSFPLKFCSS